MYDFEVEKGIVYAIGIQWTFNAPLGCTVAYDCVVLPAFYIVAHKNNGMS